VTQVPEVATTEQVPTKVEEVKVEAKVETPVEVKVEAHVETPVETKVEAKVETPVEVKVEAKVETPVEAKVETPAAETKVETAEVKEQALAQVMKAIADMASPFSGEEFNVLKDVMTKGTEILAQAEQKAQQMQSHPDFQNLIQGDSLFGIKQDGSIDANIATDQLTQLMSLLTGSQMNAQEKTLVHDLISGFSGLFAPIASGSDPMQADFEKLAQQFTSKFDKIQEKLVATPHDKLLEPQTLLSVMSEEDGGIDTQLLSQVAEKFMDKISTQFDKVLGSLEKLGEQKSA